MQIVHRSITVYETGDQKAVHPFHYWIQQHEGQDEMRLLLSIHHILYDAWTLNRLLKDVNVRFDPC